MTRRLREEDGMTLVELMIVVLILGFVMAAVSTIFVSGLRTGSDVDGRIAAQQNARVGVDRLEYEARCSSTAAVVSSGAGISLTLPSWCAHATGTATWCVASGALNRYTAATCTGTAQTFVRGITSATPFSIVTASGYLPRLQIALTANTTGRSSDAFTISEAITLRNGTRG
jgi:prepilin-type N-terminal cleavage/methylation domain-containing protein